MPREDWSSDEFVAEAVSWVADHCHRSGTGLTGHREEPRCRPWSAVMRIGSDDGLLWFKVNGSGTAHEAGLTSLLGRVRPGLTPAVLAIEPSRHWWLARDAGPTMRTILRAEDQWGVWEHLLPIYADAQLQLATRRDDLIASSLPDRSPARLPGLLRALTTRLADVGPERGGLDADQAVAIERLIPAYDAWCEQLVASGVEDSVQHDDLHSNNACWNAMAERWSIIDWGDASLGHPFVTMLATANSIAYHADLPDDAIWADNRMKRIRDAYLEPFTAAAPLTDLIRSVDVARRVGCVSRALCYDAALADDPGAHRHHEFPVRGWLLELLEA